MQISLGVSKVFGLEDDRISLALACLSRIKPSCEIRRNGCDGRSLHSSRSKIMRASTSGFKIRETTNSMENRRRGNLRRSRRIAAARLRDRTARHRVTQIRRLFGQ